MNAPTDLWLESLAHLAARAVSLRHKVRRNRATRGIEPLETRTLMTAITVDNLTDSPVTGQTDLRQALAEANTAGLPATIDFQTGDSGTITLTNVDTAAAATGAGNSALVVANDVTIDGDNGGTGITISGDGSMRLFYVDSGSSLTLNDLTLSEGESQGGAGGGVGGGGGAGLGGAIFNAGTLTVTGSTFTGNTAQGGAGAHGGPLYSGGGGGGLGGGNGGTSDSLTPGDGGGTNGGAAATEFGAAGTGGFGGGGGGGDSGGFNTQGGGDGGFGGGGGGRGVESGTTHGGVGGFGGGGGFGDAGDGSVGGFGGGNPGGGASAGGGGGMGGAIFNYLGTANLADSTFTANSAIAGAAGSGSATAGQAYGGAVFNYNGDLTSTNVTLSGNTAASGGRGIYNLGDGATATATIDNTIIGQSDTDVSDFVGNTINGGTSTTSGTGDLIGFFSGFAGTVVSSADPMLGSLANNGGNTQTLLPARTSPAVGAGDPAAVGGATTDQRGVTRIIDGQVDIGAVEQEPPVVFTSASSTTGTVGSAMSFTVTTTSYGVPTLTQTGTLPAGVTFTDNGDGTATLAGTPSADGSFTATLTGVDAAGPTQQTFTFNVDQAPAITSTTAATFGIGQASTFTFSTTGFPAPALSETGALPGGVTFVDNGDGTATLAGTPADASGGTYALTVAADNGVGSDATQTFTLTVNQVPAITSEDATAFTFGQNGSFTVTTTGFPTPALSESGDLPQGVTFVNDGDGTGTISGTPATGTTGTYDLTLGASNTAGTAPSQSFALTVDPAPVTITLDTPAPTYDGLPQGESATTTPAGVALSYAYGGSSTVPTNGGTYAVVATSADPDYSGTASGSLVIAPATPAIKLTTPVGAIYDGSPKAATATITGVPGGTVPAAPVLTYYAGATASGTPLNGVPTSGGTYTVVASHAAENNYSAVSQTATYSVARVTPLVFLNISNVPYTGSPRGATATVVGLALGATPAPASLLYFAGSSLTGTPLSGPPTAIGTYTVLAEFNGDADYVPASASAVYTIYGNPLAAPVSGTGIPGSKIVLNPLASATSQDGGTLSLGILTQPSLGSVSIVNVNGAEQFLYQPRPGAFMSDSFTFQVNDIFGGSTTETATINYAGVGVVASSLNPGRSDLVVIETGGNHAITFTDAKGATNVNVTIDGALQGKYSKITGRVFGFAPAGSDSFTGTTITNSMWVYGGTGDDTMLGGAGGDVLIGGPGNDLLNGGAGRNFLIGGGGTDTLVAHKGKDVSVAGTTAYDAPSLSNQAALLQMLSKWETAGKLPPFAPAVGSRHHRPTKHAVSRTTMARADDVLIGKARTKSPDDDAFAVSADAFSDGPRIGSDN